MILLLIPLKKMRYLVMENKKLLLLHHQTTTTALDLMSSANQSVNKLVFWFHPTQQQAVEFQALVSEIE